MLQTQTLKKYFQVGKRGKERVFVHAVDGVTLELQEGETLALVGESGSGKSTLAYTVVGMYKPTSGRLLYRGQDIGMEAGKRPANLRKDIQIVFQDPGSSLNPQHTVKRILEMPLRVHRGELRRQQLRAVVLDLMQRVELPSEYLYKTPPSISGGEKQRVAIARALASEPSLVVLDEPTSALDVSVQATIISRLVALQRELGLTYLFITHDLSLVRNVATRVAVMYLGKVSELADAVELFENPLHPYTRMLLSSIPVLTEKEERLRPEKVVSYGEIPSPVDIPPGCSFHSRCRERSKTCLELDPEMASVGPGHFVRCHLQIQTPREPVRLRWTSVG
jgi:peptide/nickel transport system ATP-binding protein